MPTLVSAEAPGDVHDAESLRAPDETAWNHLEHWMWPLFTDKWGFFRAQLGLHPCPLGDEEDEAALGITDASVHTYCSASGSIPVTRGDYSKDVDWTRVPPVLYLFSSLVVDVSPFWPDSVSVCGYVRPHPPIISAMDRERIRSTRTGMGEARVGGISPHRSGDKKVPDRRLKNEELGTLSPEVEAFLCGDKGKPIFISFGSMWGMCPPEYGLACALETVLLGARQARARCLVILPRQEPMKCKVQNKGGKEAAKESVWRELKAAIHLISSALAAAGEHEALVRSMRDLRLV